jgi:hypothetical protein
MQSTALITCQPFYLEARCRERGYTLDQVRPCIVAEHEDGTITVDTDHPAYPRPRPGLGDMVAAGLSAVGITKERVSALVGGDCGCKQRQEALNRIGHRLGIGSPPQQ